MGSGALLTVIAWQVSTFLGGYFVGGILEGRRSSRELLDAPLEEIAFRAADRCSAQLCGVPPAQNPEADRGSQCFKNLSGLHLSWVGLFLLGLNAIVNLLIWTTGVFRWCTRCTRATGSELLVPACRSHRNFR